MSWEMTIKNIGKTKLGRWLRLSNDASITSSRQITKASLFDNNGNLVLEKDFPPINMMNGDSLELTWTLDAINGGVVVPRQRQIDLNQWAEQQDQPAFASDGDLEMEEAIQAWYDRL